MSTASIVEQVRWALDELYLDKDIRSQYTVGALPGIIVITQDRPQRHCRSWCLPSDGVERARHLADGFRIYPGITPACNRRLPFLRLETDGLLTISPGYSWDGASGPVVDTSEVMRASLVHDALYEFMRNLKLSARDWRDTADRLFEKLCVEDGVSPRTAHLYCLALEHFGGPSASPENKREVHIAP